MDFGQEIRIIIWEIVENEDLLTAKSILESIISNKNKNHSNLNSDDEREHLKYEMAKVLKKKNLQKD